jgi:hypothetical protein
MHTDLMVMDTTTTIPTPIKTNLYQSWLEQQPISNEISAKIKNKSTGSSDHVYLTNQIGIC